MSYLKAVESRIQEAMAAGAFRGLKGEGRPLNLRAGEFAGDLWLGFHLLENERLLPPWLELAREIERDLQDLERVDRTHAALAAEATISGAWETFLPRLHECRQAYEALARRVRAKQDRFNVEAPGIRSERPGIWVEFHLDRLDERLRVAGSPSGEHAASR